MLPQTDLDRATGWVEARNAAVPADVRTQVRYELDVDDRSATLVECRPPWDGVGETWTRLPVARFRYVAKRQEWSLYWRDSDSKFHLYDHVRPTPTIDALLEEVDRDPAALFWG